MPIDLPGPGDTMTPLLVRMRRWRKRRRYVRAARAQEAAAFNLGSPRQWRAVRHMNDITRVWEGV